MAPVVPSHKNLRRLSVRAAAGSGTDEVIGT